MALQGSILPTLGATIQVPNPFVDTDEGRRVHRRVSRAAAKYALQWHNVQVFEEHFRRGNRNKYQHRRRDEKYATMKRYVFKEFTDLKKKGTSHLAMIAQMPKVSFKTKMDDGIEFAYMRYRWPHSVGAQTPGKVTKEQMNEELTRWTDSEVGQATNVFEYMFLKKYNEELATRKKFKKRIGDVRARM